MRQLVNALRTACALLDPAEPAPNAAGPAVVRLRDVSAQATARAIEVSRGNMSEAARRLGISRNTPHRRLTGQGKGET